MRRRLLGLGAALQLCAAVSLAAVTVSVSPDTVSLRAGSQKQFSVTVSGAATTAVTWTASAGTITSTGFYTAPGAVPAPNTVTIKATAAADGKTSDTSVVTVLNPSPSIEHLSPTRINTGVPFTLVIDGEGFLATTQVTLGGAVLACTAAPPQMLTCKGTSTAAAGSELALVVKNPDPGAASTSRNIKVLPPYAVAVSPDAVSLRVNEKKQFGVAVSNTPEKSVTWSATGGTITSTGLYQAPATVPTPNTVNVKALLAIDGKTSDTSVVTVLNPEPHIERLSPSQITSALPFTLVITGSGFLPSSTVMLGTDLLKCTVDSGTQITCKSTITAPAGALALVVKNPDPGAISSSPRSLNVVPPVAVLVSPDTISLRVGEKKQFSASVSNTSEKTVTWSATAGTISTTGLYQAPATAPVPNTVNVKATATVDGKTTDTSVVTVLNPVPSVAHLSPAQINTGLPFTLDIDGNGFLPTSQVTLGDASLKCTVDSAIQLTCTGTSTAAAGTSLALVVKNPDPGAAASSPRTITVLAPISVSVSPETVNVRLGDTKQLNVSVKNALDKTVVWKASAGTIDAAGLYTPPAALPTPNKVTVTATSKMDPAASDTSTITLLNPQPAITSASPASVSPGAVTLTIKGTGFTSGAQVAFGPALFQTVSVTPTQIVASGVASPVAGGVVGVRVSNPEPGAASSAPATIQVAVANPLVSYGAAVRFLEQATFGADPDDVVHLQQVGIDKWLAEQKAAPQSTYDDPPDESTGLSALQARFFVNATTGPDQLRQRVAFALGQIFVISGVKIPKAVAWVPWLRMLSENAFGNYRELMRDSTLSPAMGHYLDMVNNDKANARTGTLANENYARELLQLFTIGTVMLNPDGSTKQGPNGPTITYDETLIQNMARAFTGWTYPPLPGTAPVRHNPEHYFGDMVAVESNHDTGSKTLLFGKVLSPGQTAMQDVDAALDNIFQHPNVGPFVALRLIQHLTMSNPSAGYVQRVAAVFDNNGAGVRGDLWAVTRAVLLDTEARQESASALPLGHLREPVLYMTHLLRALGGTAAAGNSLASRGDDMGQRLFYSPSVFNYYSPFYRTANGALAGPEFQNLSPSTAITRPNFVYSALNGGLGANVRLDISNFYDIAGDTAKLLDAVDQALMRGGMSAGMRTAIAEALAAVTDARTRARYALYLAATSPQYQVER